MFLSPNTLYLAVWNVAHGEEGVETLRKWLLNIQVGRQASISLIIGSFDGIRLIHELPLACIGGKMS